MNRPDIFDNSIIFEKSNLSRGNMIRYKVDVIQKLKEAGYSTYRLQKEKLLATTTLVKLRNGNTTITVESLNAICDMLECQPGDLLEWHREEDTW